MTFQSGDYRYGLDDYVKNVKDSLIDAGCAQTCVDDVLTADAATIKAAASNCGCPQFMLQWNAHNPTLALAEGEAPPAETEPAAAEPTAAEPAAAEPNTTEPVATEPTQPAGEADPAPQENPEPENSSESKTGLYVGGGLGVLALIGGIVYYNKSKPSEENEGGEFERAD